MKAYSIEITKFRFPVDLGDAKANFRLQVDLRHRDDNGSFGIHTVVLPGLDLYWECSKDDNEAGRFKADGHLVRKEGEQESGKRTWEPEVDFTKVGPWGKRVPVRHRAIGTNSV